MTDIRKNLLSLYERNFRKIPVFDEMMVDLEDLYVRQELKIIHQSGKSGKRDKPVKQPDKENKSINAIEDIFYKDGKICENVLISSEPGLGKSTFCKLLVRRWYKGHTLDEIKLTQGLRAMRVFKLLFYIDLREANIKQEAPTSDEIATIIHEQLELTDVCTIAGIRKFLSESSTLVVMDSLDELGAPRFPKRGKHNQSCIVTTSRPWKIEALRSELKNIDQHIEIVGLENGSPTNLANNVLKLINNGSSQTKTGDEFILDMKTKEVQHFLNTPLLLIQMLGLWLSGESFGNSQFEMYSEVIHQQICKAVKTKSLPDDVSRGSKKKVPFCNKSNQCPCRDYGDLMWKVTQLAYHTLFNKDRQMCLVFEHDVTSIYGLSTEEVELCLKIGVLTQHRFFVRNPNEQKKTVSFPHKTYQEYFASIYLSRQSDDQSSNLDHIRSITCDLNQALELDKVLLFCSELDLISSTNATHQLSYLISVKADDDSRVQEYRQSCYRDGAPHVNLIKKIQNMIITATQQNAVLPLSDIILDNSPLGRRTENNIDVCHLDMTGVKSIHVESVPVASDVLKQLQQCERLQKLVLFDSGINVKNIYKMIVRNLDTLETLGLGGNVLSNRLKLSRIGKKFRETLTAKLSSLTLSEVKLSHRQCQLLSQFVSSSHIPSCLSFSSPHTATHNLRQVELSDIDCELHWILSPTCLKLDFTRHENLQTVKLAWLPDMDVNLNPQTLHKCFINLPDNLSAQTYIIQCLNSARNLQELTCERITYCEQLAEVLPQLHSLQRIVICEVDFGRLCQISLSATMEQLNSVELSCCTIADDCLSCLLSSLPGHSVMVELYLVTVKGGVKSLHDIRISSNIEITWDEVEMDGDGWRAEWLIFDNFAQFV